MNNEYKPVKKQVKKEEDFSGKIDNVSFVVENGLWFWINDKFNMKSETGFKTLKQARKDAFNAFC